MCSNLFILRSYTHHPERWAGKHGFSHANQYLGFWTCAPQLLSMKLPFAPSDLKRRDMRFQTQNHLRVIKHRLGELLLWYYDSNVFFCYLV